MKQIDFYHRELETLDRARLRQLQDERLRCLPRQLATNRFYVEKSHRAALDLEMLHSAEDLKRLPFTTKGELVAEQQAHPPYGRLLTYPLARYSYLHQTSGTTGQPLKWLDTREDWENWMRCWGYVYRSAGVREEDLVFCAFSFGPYLSHWAAIDGARHIGALCISGGGLSSEQRLRMIIESDCTVLVCTPTYALHLAEVAEGMGLDLRSSAIHTTIHAGEPGASVPATRDLIERSFGARCFDHTGMTELGPTGVSCDARDGVHLIESEFVFEVRDDGGAIHVLPETGTITGELVATNLGRWGSPLIRYRTGDRVELTREPCSCGSPFAKMVGGIRGRVDDMFTVRGVNLYPSQVEDLVRRYTSIGEFRIEVRSVRGMEEVTILCECDGDDGESTVSRLAADLRLALGARIECRPVAIGTLPRSDLKSRRLIRT